VCLGEIAQVDGIVAPDQLRVTSRGRTLVVSTMAAPDAAAVGDWVLIHSGFVLGRISAEQAHAALAARTVITQGET
jgi:hydrogenase maturation factor